MQDSSLDNEGDYIYGNEPKIRTDEAVWGKNDLILPLKLNKELYKWIKKVNDDCEVRQNGEINEGCKENEICETEYGCNPQKYFELKEEYDVKRACIGRATNFWISKDTWRSFDKIVNFNYTTNWLKAYDINENIVDFIHGNIENDQGSKGDMKKLAITPKLASITIYMIILN